MQAKTYQAFKRAVPSLTSRQRKNIGLALDQYDQNTHQTFDKKLEQYFCQHPLCPHCHTENIKKWGFKQGRQRFKCNVCGKTFNAFTDTPLARLRKPEKWPLYLQDMTESVTLRPAAKHCNISLKTAFLWRHRFLAIIENDMTDKLEGIVELDETFFRESFKGQKRNLPRPARKRGNQRKDDCKNIPVLVAKDRQGGIRDSQLDSLSFESMTPCLAGHIDAGTPLCADAFTTHERLAVELNLTLKELVTTRGIHILEGVFHLQNVNAYHSHLKQWIEGIFHGVATRYLKHYLGWRRLLADRIPLTVEGLQKKIAYHWIKQHLAGT